MENLKSKYSSIKLDLLSVGAIQNENIEIYSESTRDNSKLKVFRDTASKVIFIEDFYIGDSEYSSGEYRNNYSELNSINDEEFENILDTNRRFNSLKQLIANKDILDFGCGKGSFLKKIQSLAKSSEGLELQKSFAEYLNSQKILCHQCLSEVNEPKDVITLFHSFEHLPHPINTLKELHSKLKQNGIGKIIIEVPNARDFLINQLSIESFKRHTLWSQHLILHTRESLTRFLAAAGFKNIVTEGVQRYNLANHLYWLSANIPGGHKSIISIIQTPELTNAYASALGNIDATDTITAIATT